MSALDHQIAGSHYQMMAIQPVDFIMKNKLDFLQGNVVKYICRYRSKNGRQDLQKAIHCIEILIEMYDTELKAKEEQ
jgi:hypothetical protein